MVFSSFTFLAVFLPLAVLFYFPVKNRHWRNAVLLVFSLVFYAWGEPKFVILMLVSIAVNYLSGLMIEKSEKRAVRLLWMTVGIGISTGMLFWFKYSAFLANSILSVFGSGASVPDRVLPIGISFFTFQIITYTVDVYRKRVPAQKNPVKLALYISFFPQLIAGPIVNYTYIEPYLDERKITPYDAFAGSSRFITGLGKKLIFANLCEEVIQSLPADRSTSLICAWIAALAFTLQIYLDFSGYSDMAIGLGRIFGFRFLENFDYPYVSLSVTEFWRRWHISLGAFFRDYVYIPLGGNRCTKGRQIFNLLAVWMLTGLWHGASWNFVVWGLFYGILLIIEKFLLKNVLQSVPKPLRWLGTALAVIVGWVIFMHDGLSEGISHIGALIGIGRPLTDEVSVAVLRTYLLYLVFAALCCFPFKKLAQKILRVPEGDTDGKNVPVAAVCLQFVFCGAVLALSLTALAGSSFNPFLYFRF